MPMHRSNKGSRAGRSLADVEAWYPKRIERDRKRKQIAKASRRRNRT